MKKTICKYEYDTEKSVIVKKFVSGAFGDEAGFEETLYQTADGKLFLYVNGGSQSPYPNEDIKRIGKDKAELWIANHE